MADKSMYSLHTIVHTLQPRASETKAEFRRRMQELITGFVAQAPDRLTVVIDEQDGTPSCVVSARTGRTAR